MRAWESATGRRPNIGVSYAEEADTDAALLYLADVRQTIAMLARSRSETVAYILAALRFV